MSNAVKTTRVTPAADDMAAHAQQAANLLKSMGNAHRLLILCVLGDTEMSVGALNEHIPLSQSALSQHLAILRAEGLVNTRRESQTIHYSVRPGPALDLIRVLHRHFCASPTPA
jgi:ArsR family transcriptional regulator, virulence genes transcriptional regulator